MCGDGPVVPVRRSSLRRQPPGRPHRVASAAPLLLYAGGHHRRRIPLGAARPQTAASPLPASADPRTGPAQPLRPARGRPARPAHAPGSPVTLVYSPHAAGGEVGPSSGRPTWPGQRHRPAGGGFAPPGERRPGQARACLPGSPAAAPLLAACLRAATSPPGERQPQPGPHTPRPSSPIAPPPPAAHLRAPLRPSRTSPAARTPPPTACRPLFRGSAWRVTKSGCSREADPSPPQRHPVTRFAWSVAVRGPHPGPSPLQAASAVDSNPTNRWG